MKAFLILLLWIPSFVAFAQQDSLKPENNREQVLSTNLLGPFSIGFEKEIKGKTSIYFTGRYISFDFFGRSTYFSFTSEVRFYPGNQKVMNGFYLGPYIKFRSQKDTEELKGILSKDLEARAYFLGGGISLGYQKIFRKGFALNFAVGAGYTPAIFKEVIIGDKDHWEAVNEADLRTGFSIGYAF